MTPTETNHVTDFKIVCPIELTLKLAFAVQVEVERVLFIRRQGRVGSRKISRANTKARVWPKAVANPFRKQYDEHSRRPTTTFSSLVSLLGTCVFM
jgi:hypothetical protein